MTLERTRTGQLRSRSTAKDPYGSILPPVGYSTGSRPVYFPDVPNRVDDRLYNHPYLTGGGLLGLVVLGLVVAATVYLIFYALISLFLPSCPDLQAVNRYFWEPCVWPLR